MSKICPTCENLFENAEFCPRDGTLLVESSADSPEQADRAGQVIDRRYRLIRMVGSGGMGEVYEAEHVVVTKKVAVKLLKPAAAKDARAVERLYREAHAISAVAHVNIVRVEDFGRDEDGTVYLAMEWLDGETLEQRLGRAPMDRATAIRTVCAACDGLEAAHDAGVVHRDVKPANIFLVGDPDNPTVKLVDFGIAKLVQTDNEGYLTQSGQFVGTPHYVAPEQALGDELDGTADVYALGVILYRLVTGVLPFTVGSFMDILQHHISVRPKAPRDAAPDRDISPAMEAIILRCLNKKPEQRYATARELRDALLDLDSATDSSRSFDELTLPRRRNGWLVAAMLVGVAGIGGGGWYLGQQSPPTLNALPSDLPPPSRTEWQHTGKGDTFAYRITLTPSPLMAGTPAILRLSILDPSTAFAIKMANGKATATLELTYADNGGTAMIVSRRIAKTGTLVDPIALTFPDNGKYRAHIRLSASGRTHGSAQFELCVGADPAGDPKVLGRVCPNLNKSGESASR